MAASGTPNVKLVELNPNHVGTGSLLIAMSDYGDWGPEVTPGTRPSHLSLFDLSHSIFGDHLESLVPNKNLELPNRNSDWLLKKVVPKFILNAQQINTLTRALHQDLRQPSGVFNRQLV